MIFYSFVMLRWYKSILKTSIINIFEFIAAFLHFNQSGDLIFDCPFSSFTVVDLTVNLLTDQN